MATAADILSKFIKHGVSASATLTASAQSGQQKISAIMNSHATKQLLTMKKVDDSMKKQKLDVESALRWTKTWEAVTEKWREHVTKGLAALNGEFVGEAGEVVKQGEDFEKDLSSTESDEEKKLQGIVDAEYKEAEGKVKSVTDNTKNRLTQYVDDSEKATGASQSEFNTLKGSVVNSGEEGVESTLSIFERAKRLHEQVQHQLSRGEIIGADIHEILDAAAEAADNQKKDLLKKASSMVDDMGGSSSFAEIPPEMHNAALGVYHEFIHKRHAQLVDRLDAVAKASGHPNWTTTTVL